MLNAVTNKGSGPELILVHGNSMDHSVWSQQLVDPALSQFRLTAIDLPGHGGSAPYPAERPYTVEAFAADVAAFVAGRDRPYVVGHSLGGHICLRVLQRAPQVRG